MRFLLFTSFDGNTIIDQMGQLNLFFTKMKIEAPSQFKSAKQHTSEHISGHTSPTGDTSLGESAIVSPSIDSGNHAKMRSTFLLCIRELVRMSWVWGGSGNLWHSYLTRLLIQDENPYSLSCEGGGQVDSSLTSLATNDLKMINQAFAYPLDTWASVLDVPQWKQITPFEGQAARGFDPSVECSIEALINSFAQSPNADDMESCLRSFYHRCGVGNFGLYMTFRVRSDNCDVGNLSPQVHYDDYQKGDRSVHARYDDYCSMQFPIIDPIGQRQPISFHDLIGYDRQKEQLIQNTKAFVDGKPANHCLLYGDAGTGKSTCIRALAHTFYSEGLRVIEIYKHQVGDLRAVIDRIKQRRYKFILYMDDLSFEDFEVEYKYLKAIIEGGLEQPPSNILLYATSNRRHLIKENEKDREDMHKSDTVNEKLSLVARFGVKIYFGVPERNEYFHIVDALAQKSGLHLPDEQLFDLAAKWELTHLGPSGRSARQLIDHLLGQATAHSNL